VHAPGWAVHPLNVRNGGYLEEVCQRKNLEVFFNEYDQFSQSVIGRVTEELKGLPAIIEPMNEFRTDAGWIWACRMGIHFKDKVRILASAMMEANEDNVDGALKSLAGFYHYISMHGTCIIDQLKTLPLHKKLVYSTDGCRGKWSGFQGRPGAKEMTPYMNYCRAKKQHVEWMLKRWDVEHSIGAGEKAVLALFKK